METKRLPNARRGLRSDSTESEEGIDYNMAKPAPLAIASRDVREELRARLECAPEEHAEAILEGFELLQELHDAGVLNLLGGMLRAGDRLADIGTSALDTPAVVRAMRNFILLTKFFGSLDSDVLSSLAQTVMQGAEKEKGRRAPGFVQLFRRLRSEDCRHALAILLDLVEAVGKGL